MSIRNDIINNVLEAMAVIKDSDDYDVRIAKIMPYNSGYLQLAKAQTPVLMVHEDGEEVQLVADGTNDRFQIILTVTGFTTGGTHDTVQRDSNNMVAALKQFANSDPSLGTYVLAMFWNEMPNYQITPEGQSTITGKFNVIYWTAKGSY